MSAMKLLDGLATYVGPLDLARTAVGKREQKSIIISILLIGLAAAMAD